MICLKDSSNVGIRKVFSIALLMVMVLTLATGCGKSNDNDLASNAKKIDTGSKVIVDQNGRKVEIKENPSRIVTTALPLPGVYYLVNGSCNELLGIHPASKSAAETSVLSVLAPELADSNTAFIKGRELNVEELMKLNPDMVLFWGTYEEQLEQLETAGIPAVAVKSDENWNALETLREWIKILGDISGKTETAGEIVVYAEETQQMINSRLKNLEDKNKPRSIILFRHDSEEITVSGSEHYGQCWLESTGALNAASELKAISTVNMEQIYKWNPEIIYISNFTETQPEDLINNNIKEQDWSKVRAVQEGKVYKIPLGIYRWYPPSGDVPLMLKWMAQKNHPQMFNDYDMEQELEDYYKEFYSFTLSGEEIERILHPVSAGAKGATKW